MHTAAIKATKHIPIISEALAIAHLFEIEELFFL